MATKKKDNRGKAKKPRRSGRQAVKDPKVVDPKNRPSEDEMKAKGGKQGNLEKLVYRTIDWIKEGMSLDTCKEILTNQLNPATKKPYHPRFVNEVVTTANTTIKEYYNYHKSQLIALHTKRYDKDINELLNIDVSGYLPYKQTEKKIEAYMRLLDVMQQKETLLGMHRKSFRLIINNEQTTIVREKKARLDISKLSLQEQIELNNLLEKARKNEDEIGGVILRDKPQEVTEDAEYVVVDNKLNVDRMEHREPKELNSAPIGSTLTNVEDRLKLALQKKAKEEFKKVGSKTVDEDIIPEKV